LCPENAIPLAYLQCSKPLILWIDASLSSLVGFYSYLDDLCEETKKNIYQLEKSAFEQCDRLVFTSDWAAQSASEIYNLPSSKIKVIPRGGNLRSERTLEEVQTSIASRTTDTCKLLFVGVDWERKGGDFAVQVAHHLNELGIKTELWVIGVTPKLEAPLPEFVKVFGYIDKSTVSGSHKFDNLFSQAHFLILHTQADCGPNVLIEANSYGVPCVSSNVGGIPTQIHEGKNGKTFSLQVESQAYSHYIAEIFQNWQQYEELALSSFQEYQNRLNWTVTGKAFQSLFQEVLS
jgi:glycosyltransferase involved in cell wall biosynthesis